MAPHSNRTDSFTTSNTDGKPKLAKSSPPRNVEWIEQVSWDSSLQPKNYEIQGTHPNSKILFLNVNILDSTGREPYLGDVLIEGQTCLEHNKLPTITDTTTGQKITYVGPVPHVDEIGKDPKVRVFHGRGRTLMSGLGDAHTHFTWNGGDLDRLGDLGVEEHTLLTMRSAQCFIDSGYTM
jgi:hypothetical protein